MEKERKKNPVYMKTSKRNCKAENTQQSRAIYAQCQKIYTRTHISNEKKVATVHNFCFAKSTCDCLRVKKNSIQGCYVCLFIRCHLILSIWFITLGVHFFSLHERCNRSFYKMIGFLMFTFDKIHSFPHQMDGMLLN